MFFVGKIHISGTFLSGTWNYRAFFSLGTRSKATLSKCIIAISFCFSYLSGDRRQIQNCARNAFLGCVSIQQKTFHEKKVSVAKVRIFLLKRGFGTSFSLNHSGPVFPVMTLPVKKSYLYEKWKFFNEFFLLGRYISRAFLREFSNPETSYSLGTRSKSQIFQY